MGVGGYINHMDKEPENCWEFYNCQEAREKCPAYPTDGKKCWEVASSVGCILTKGAGMKFCISKCDWFKMLNK